MHEGEAEIDEALVERLLRGQFPALAGLPLRRVLPGGTDNAIYRLGDELSVRLPRMDWAVPPIAKEAAWLGRLAPDLPLAVPSTVEVGQPAEGFPYPWAIARWGPGETTGLEDLHDPVEGARQLAGFVRALRSIPVTADAPVAADNPNGRGLSLRPRDERLRESLADLERQLADGMPGTLDAPAVLAAWDRALAAPEWDEPAAWLHGDLHPGNLLGADGRFTAVIDWSDLAVGDPAIDTLPAWTIFEGKSRAAYRDELDVDDATWLRGRGWALSIAVIALPYYRDTHPDFVQAAWRMIDELLDEPDA